MSLSKGLSRISRARARFHQCRRGYQCTAGSPEAYKQLLFSSDRHLPSKHVLGSKASYYGCLFHPARHWIRHCTLSTIEVASLLHDDVLDDAETRRSVTSLNAMMGNKSAVLAGNFLLARATQVLSALGNTEVVQLAADIVDDLVTGEMMQMSATSEERLSMHYYMERTYCKTASLFSNSCKAIALLAGQTADVATLAFEYGKNLGLAYQLIDDVLDFTGTSASLGKGSLSDIHHGIVTAPLFFAIEEFPQLREVVQQGFDNPADVDLALDYLGRSQGIQRARDLAAKHTNLAIEAIVSLPKTEDEYVRRSKRALVDLSQMVITRTK